MPIKGVGFTAYFEIMAADGSPVTSDTPTVRVNGIAVTPGTPAHVAGGVWSIALSNSEANADVVAIKAAPSTSGAVSPMVVYGMLPANVANLSNLDAAVSTRLASSGYTAPNNSGISDIKAKTDLIPAGGPAAATDYTSGRAAKLDNLDAAVSTRLASSGYTAPPSAATIAAAVWDYLVSAAGATTTALGWLLDRIAAIKTRTDVIGSGGFATVSPVGLDGEITIHAGGDYASADGTSQTISFTTTAASQWPSTLVVGNTAELTILDLRTGDTVVSGVVVAVVVATGDNKQVTVTKLAATDTASLDAGPNRYRFAVIATTSNGNKAVLVTGAFTKLAIGDTSS